ncbi:MAG: tripartite tricarboxylate transporter TctB family protein [Nocardioides sp.]
MKSPTTFREADAVLGVIVAAIGVLVLVQSLQLRFYSEGVPGPGFFPALLSAALIVLGVACTVTRLRRARDAADRFELPSRGQARRSLGLWGAVLVGTLLIEPLGFLLAMLLLVAVILLVIEGRRGLGSVVTIIAVPVLAWLLFAELLQVPLPAGPFGS